MNLTWPEGVTARYLTVGTATVDLTIVAQPYKHEDGIVGSRNATHAECTGCLASEDFSHWRVHKGDWSSWDVQDPDAADQQACNWSQTHAEKCRAMPQPTPDQQRNPW
ncbi:hypothetical protein ACFV5J_25045 [Streptomyces zaomyceticus]|uniref:hypothetical protein n=1 Tax=Streptomyces zaomyceticus TaxID=68286 RepID=UPI003667DC7E